MGQACSRNGKGAQREVGRRAGEREGEREMKVKEVIELDQSLVGHCKDSVFNSG